MIEQIMTFLDNNLIILALLMILCLVVMFYSYQKLQTLEFAKYVAGEGQFMPLPESTLDEALERAEKQGNKREFLTLLAAIRKRHGHDNVKIGHLYWIWQMIEDGKSNSEPDNIPSFYDEEIDTRRYAFKLIYKRLETLPEPQLKECIKKLHGELINKGQPKDLTTRIEIHNKYLVMYGLEPVEIPKDKESPL